MLTQLILINKSFLSNIVGLVFAEGMILSGHDISDGGFITCLLEMAFAGLRGLQITMNFSKVGCIEALFNEELGLILEVSPANIYHCVEMYSEMDIRCYNIGYTSGEGMKSQIRITYNAQEVLNCQLYQLLKLWEETSYQLDLLQANTECVNEEWKGNYQYFCFRNIKK